MATSLGAQLAQIRNENTNPLDLKAQKKAHSQSLIFEPQIAGAQDFDTIYQLCYDGFNDLCHLDSRFLSFAETLFSEQGKSQDRTQMTSTQNMELDIVLEDFIYLISSHLSLKPALKAIEWIIRRFRAHENNTLILALAFLPYHASSIFTTMLSILPQKLPQQIKFLYPYIQSLANPSRQTIVYSASNSKPLLAALSSFVLKTCQKWNQSSALVSFWASITTEAVAIMVDQARSARREAQAQNHEEILIFVLPILNTALAIRDAPELRVGCYMILTVLASKVRLDEVVLRALMEAVVYEWRMESHAGLICLVVLAQQRRQYNLPRKVLKAVLLLSGLENDLATLLEQYQVDNFVLGIVTGLLKVVAKTGDVERLPRVGNLLEVGLMHESSLSIAISSILSMAAKSRTSEQQDRNIRDHMKDLILRLADSQRFGRQMQRAIDESKLDLSWLRSSLHHITQGSKTGTLMIKDTESMNIDDHTTIQDFKSILNRFPAETAFDISFLSNSESYTYDGLAREFRCMPLSTTNLAQFSDLPVLRKTLAMTEPLFMSFYIRLWCGNSPAVARAAALRTIATYLQSITLTSDVQILLPYLIFALSDPSSHVRSAAADLVLVLSSAYLKAADMKESQAYGSILGYEQIYGQSKHSCGLSWLSLRDSTRFMADLLIPHLEECVLDGQAISLILSNVLDGDKPSRNTTRAHPELKTSSKLSMFSFLCSHTVKTPLYTFKLRMLPVLNNVGKIGTTTRTKLLLPLLSEAADIGEEKLQMVCQREQINILDLLSELAGTVASNDREGIRTLKDIAEMDGFELLRSAALQRIVTIWPQLKPDLHLSLAEMLLDLAVRIRTGDDHDAQDAGAIDALHSIRLSTTILQHFLIELPTLSTRPQDKPTAAKRRRTRHGHPNTDISMGKQNLDQDIRSITLVLELVNSSDREQHSALLKGLFQVVSDLKDAQDQLSTAIGYLQILAMDTIFAIISKTKMSPDMPIDASMIRMDVLIDYIRSTSNPQVRNTALLLVASLAHVAPELVLHSVMLIFTYMGANILRQEDDFSTYVVQQTMDSVIPPLVQSLQSDLKHAFAGVSGLLVNFAAAFEHIPQQRRLEIFTSLVNKVGAEDYLFALLVILSDRYPHNRKALHLSMQLASKHSVQTQLQTIEKCLQVVLDAWEIKSSDTPNTALLDQAHSAEAVTGNLLPLTIAITKSDPLRLKLSKLLENQAADAVAVRAPIATSFEHIFLLSQHCRNNRKLHSLCLQTTDSFLNSLPSNELIHTLQVLLDRGGDDLRRQVLLSFEHHLNVKKTNDHASRESCLTFVPRLVSMIQESTDPLFKQSAISTIDQITEKYGKSSPPVIIDAVPTISGDACLGAGEASLCTASLLCIATMVEVSGEMIVPVIPLLLSKVGDNLESSISKNNGNTTLHNASYSVVLALLIYVPWMITGPDLDRILTLSHKSANTDMGPDCNQTRTETLQSIARQIDANEVFAALDRTWSCAVAEGAGAVNEHLRVLRLTIDGQAKSVIVQQSEVLGGILLKAFNLRQAHLCPPTEDGYSDDKIKQIEAAVNQTAVAMIHKLNDRSFRPMFRRIMDWATGTRNDSQGKVLRQITWYTFLYQFFDTFKAIVTSYAAFVIEDAVEILQIVRSKDNDFMRLWEMVIKTLQKTCEHDQQDFYQAPSHFMSVSTALISQIGYAAQVPITANVIPAISELAVASDSATQHKEMNGAILKYMRSDVASIRLAAVRCERALTDRLGEEWLTLLPEMLPFISELQEDDDETVEKETLRWISRIEEILGESLNPMLQ